MSSAVACCQTRWFLPIWQNQIEPIWGNMHSSVCCCHGWHRTQMISCWLSEACRSLLLHLLASRAVKSRLFSLMCSCPLHLDCLYACLVPRMMSMQNCKIWIGARLCCGVFTQCNFQLVHMSVTQLLQDSMLQVLRRCCGKRDQPKPSSFLPSRHAPIPPPCPPFPPARPRTSTCSFLLEPRSVS